MKKNTMMRLASALLVLVMLTTCAISGTFAKYVTANNGSDNARVAKFGVEIEIDDTIFSNSYKNEATTWTENETGRDITVQTKTSTEGNIIAPGTEGALAGFTVTGTPEVDVEVTYTATLTLTGWEDEDGNEYCPIEITVGSETFKVGEGNITTVAELKTAVEEAIVGKTAIYDTNTDLTAVDDDLTVSWAWDYTGNDDVNDTFLGDEAAEGNPATIELAVSMTITQVD